MFVNLGKILKILFGEDLEFSLVLCVLKGIHLQCI